MKKHLLTVLLALFGASAFAQEQPREPEPPGAAAPAEPVEPTEPAVPQANVARGQFTRGVENREPLDDLDEANTDLDTVYYFTDVRGGRGHTITHQWWHDDEMMAEVSFDVKGNRWRVWSSKEMLDDWTGTWTVRIMDDQGRMLKEDTLNYSAAPDTGDMDMESGMMDGEKKQDMEMSKARGRDKSEMMRMKDKDEKTAEKETSAEEDGEE